MKREQLTVDGHQLLGWWGLVPGTSVRGPAARLEGVVGLYYRLGDERYRSAFLSRPVQSDGAYGVAFVDLPLGSFKAALRLAEQTRERYVGLGFRRTYDDQAPADVERSGSAPVGGSRSETPADLTAARRLEWELRRAQRSGEEFPTVAIFHGEGTGFPDAGALIHGVIPGSGVAVRFDSSELQKLWHDSPLRALVVKPGRLMTTAKVLGAAPERAAWFTSEAEYLGYSGDRA